MALLSLMTTELALGPNAAAQHNRSICAQPAVEVEDAIIGEAI